MKARMPKTLALLIAFSLLLSSLPGLSESAKSQVRAFSAVPNLFGVLAVLPKKSGPIKSISATSSVSVQQNREFTITVKIKPATQAALNDFRYGGWNGALIEPVDSDSWVTISSSTITLHLAFQSIGGTGKTNIKCCSSAKPSVKDTTKVTITPVYPSSVTLNATSGSIELGSQFQLTASVLPADAANKSVKWSTSNKKIATVSSGGLVTGKKTGSATITATTVSGGRKATYKVKVVKPAPNNPVTYRALLIGNNDYDGSQYDLDNGPRNDVTMMNRALLRSSIDGRKYDGNIYGGYDYTGQQIYNALYAMHQMGADSNDVTLFFYSGHGTQSTATEAGTGIVGTDFKWIDVPTIKGLLDMIPGTVIVVLDSCYSGMFIGKNLKGGSSAKYIAPFNPKSFNSVIGSAFTAPRAKGLTTGKYQVITACRKGETSMNFPALSSGSGTVYTGLATLYIAQGCGFNLYDQDNPALLCDGNNNQIGTIKEIFDYADARVDAYVASKDDPDITQDMQYFTTNAEFPIVGRN